MLNENSKYLGILETDIIKQGGWVMEKFFKNSISGERGNYSKLNYIAEISSSV